MSEWWSSISGLEQGLFIVASVATLFLIIQIVLLLFGFSNDGDIDISDVDGGISLFTIKSLTAFFAIGGWSGMVAAGGGAPEWLTVLIAFLAGCMAFVIVFFVFKQINKLQSNGIVDYNNAIGQTASVYVSIPENMSGKGKITLILQERYTEIDAMTKEKRKLKIDELVEISELIGDTVIVKLLKEDKD
jgi:hypothetical protein